ATRWRRSSPATPPAAMKVPAAPARPARPETATAATTAAGHSMARRSKPPGPSRPPALAPGETSIAGHRGTGFAGPLVAPPRGGEGEGRGGIGRRPLRGGAHSTCAVVIFGRRYFEPAHRAALGVQHHEVEDGQRGVFAALGDVAHLVRDQPADGVEFLVVIGGRQRHAERLADAVDRGVAADAVGAVGQAEDVALVLVDVELVLDLADDLLQHVFDGDQARYPAELVDHDR